MRNARNFFSKEEQALLIKAIEEAEQNTSGEIRLHVENFCFGNPVDAAIKTFHRLKMQNTKERNGVLFYIAVISHKMAIVGDEGIHQKLGESFWKNLSDKLISSFKQKGHAAVLAMCIWECGNELKKIFPIKEDNKNELSNSISFGK